MKWLERTDCSRNVFLCIRSTSTEYMDMTSLIIALVWWCIELYQISTVCTIGFQPIHLNLLKTLSLENNISLVGWLFLMFGSSVEFQWTKIHIYIWNGWNIAWMPIMKDPKVCMCAYTHMAQFAFAMHSSW